MTTTDRRAACIILTAAAGNVRDARGLVGRAIRTGLGISRWLTAPHYVSYVSTAEMLGDEPRFTFDATEDEMAAISKALHAAAEAEGWDRAPVDIYHD